MDGMHTEKYTYTLHPEIIKTHQTLNILSEFVHELIDVKPTWGYFMPRG